MAWIITMTMTNGFLWVHQIQRAEYGFFLRNIENSQKSEKFCSVYKDLFEWATSHNIKPKNYNFGGSAHAEGGTELPHFFFEKMLGEA